MIRAILAGSIAIAACHIAQPASAQYRAPTLMEVYGPPSMPPGWRWSRRFGAYCPACLPPPVVMLPPPPPIVVLPPVPWPPVAYAPVAYAPAPAAPVGALYDRPWWSYYPAAFFEYPAGPYAVPLPRDPGAAFATLVNAATWGRW